MSVIELPPKNTNTLISLMRYCHLPMPYKRPIREMKLNDKFVCGKVIIEINDEIYHGQAFIEKIRGKGQYKYYARWTIPTKPNRPDVMTYGKFVLNTGGSLLFNESHEHIKLFAKICRYLSRLANKVTREEYCNIYKPNRARPLYQGLWIDRHNCTREPVFLTSYKKRVVINYGDDFIINPLNALINKAAIVGALPYEFNDVAKDK